MKLSEAVVAAEFVLQDSQPISVGQLLLPVDRTVLAKLIEAAKAWEDDVDVDQLEAFEDNNAKAKTNALLREVATKLWTGCGNPRACCEAAMQLVEEMERFGWLEWLPQDTQATTHT